MWLQRSLTHSQAELGAAWLDAYLTAPIWRFVLGERILDGGPWVGVMVASVDRVGRYFPLTLCASVPTLDLSAGTLSDWQRSLDDVVRAALDPACAVDVFDAALQSHVWDCMRPDDEGAGLGKAILRGETFARFESATGIGQVMDELASSAQARMLATHSLWWCEDTEGRAGGFVCHGMPNGAVYSRMLQYLPGEAVV